MSHDFENRFWRLVEAIRAKSLSGVILTSPANIYYFTGLKIKGVLLALSEGSATLYSSRVYGPISTKLGEVEVSHVRPSRGELTLMIFDELRDRRLAIGYDNLTAETYQRIVKNAPNILLAPFSESIWEIRQPKTDEEIGLLTKAAKITSSAIETVRDFISPGATVGELRRFLAEEIFRAGGEGLSFNPSIMVGDELRYGVESDTDKSLRKGDIVSIKAGAIIGGYHSCIARTYYLGHTPPEPLLNTYKAALSLMESYERLSVSWTPALTVYERMVAAAKSAGLDISHVDVHGFGLGLEGSELPEISLGSADILREGSVVSVEVGIFSPTAPSYRVGDMYVVEGKYPRRLSELGRELGLR
ncbi:MAG: Xaa-Pro peptidase family protein [Nitrososphaerota archaeon]